MVSSATKQQVAGPWPSNSFQNCRVQSYCMKNYRMKIYCVKNRCVK